ncbi:hypothetical protein DRN73_04655 [Candidatus Pacearchaeota archaeon]|nr:MAG: hypothetical protein DRN73_04655 [Candidatus Pacearchaeota archaeon]
MTDLKIRDISHRVRIDDLTRKVINPLIVLLALEEGPKSERELCDDYRIKRVTIHRMLDSKLISYLKPEDKFNINKDGEAIIRELENY